MLLSHVNQRNFKKKAIVQILNKITNSVYEYTIETNQEFAFDILQFEALKCWQSPADQVPESKILIKIYTVENKKKKSLFYGWLFASSPSASGLEHPIYDITAIKCL